jgi:hypothetical protein
MTTKIRSRKELAQEALSIASASNLCGLAQSFARVMRDLGEYTAGTEARNQHPIALVWSDKIASLTGTQSSCTMATAQAYNTVTYLANASEDPTETV